MNENDNAAVDNNDNPIPVIPVDDESFLAILKTSGIQQPLDATVVAGIKAYLASKKGLFDLPKILLDKMQTAAESLNKPIRGGEFAEVRRIIVERDYAAILDAIDGQGCARYIDGDKRKKVLERVKSTLLPALVSFHGALQNYRTGLQESLGQNVMMAFMSGNQQAMEMARMSMVMPNTMQLKSAAEKFVVKANATFAVWGEAAARCLASDAIQIKKVLQLPQLPGLCGYASAEDFMMNISKDVTSEDIALEANLARYAYLLLVLNRGVAADAEKTLIGELMQIDIAINWNSLPL